MAAVPTGVHAKEVQKKSLGADLALRLALGGGAAVIAQVVCQPIETTKVRLQNEMGHAGHQKKYGNFFRAFPLIFREEGMAGLYKGMVPSALRELSYSALRFGLYSPIKKLLGEKSPQDTPMWKKLLSGGLAGGLGAGIANPTDLLKIRMQADQSRTPTPMKAHIQEIYRNDGILGFWKGTSLTVTRAVILGATKLATYDEAKQQLNKRFGWTGYTQQFGASVLAGLAYVITTAPADFARTRLMASKQMAAQTGVVVAYTSGLDVIRQTLKTEGPFALYKGFLPQWARAAPYTIVQLMAWEALCKMCGTNAV